MTPKEIYRFIIEQSPEPLIKNPVLRNVVDQERLGFYLGKKVPSQGTLEDADTKKAEDALSGVNETMKIADLQRQGHIGHYYSDGGDVKKQKVGKYTIKRKGAAGLLQPRDMVAEPLTPYEKIKLKKKFPKIKFNFKEYPNFGISGYDKKLKQKVNTKEYDAVRRYIFRGFTDTTKFKVLPVSVQNEIKGQFPEVKNWDFNKYAYGVSPGRIGEKERRLKGLPPKDNRALVRKIARFVDEPEEFRYKFRVGNADGFMLYSMDRAFLQGNENYKPIKQGGKVVGFIDRTKDGGGKKYYYNGYIVNNKLKPGEKIIKDHPDFKKVKKFHDVALKSKLSLDDTSDVFKQLFPKGFDTSKIKFNDLVQFVSNKASKRNLYNAIVKHHTMGVGTNPTKDLQILTSVFNKQADDIGALIKKGDFSRVQELKDKGIRIVVDGKAYGAPKETAEAGYQRILSNVIEDVKTFKQKDFKNFQNFQKQLSKNLDRAGFKCALSEGTDCNDPRSYRKSMQETMQKASQGDNAAVRRIQNLGKIMNKVKGAAKATGYGALIEIGFAAPLATIDWARGANKQEIVSNATFGLFGKSMDEQLRDRDIRYRQIAALEDAGTKEEKMRKRLETAGGYRSIAQNQQMLENAMAETDKAAQPFIRPNPQLESGQMFDQDKYFSDIKYMQDEMAKEEEAKKQRAIKRGFYQPDFDVFAEEMSYAGGGIAGIRRPSAIPPQSGPLPDGLPGVLKRVKNI